MDTLAPPRASMVSVEVARPALAPGSLHAATTEETETLMIGTMQDLRVDAVEKQRELEEQLQSIAARREAALDRLTNAIIPQREERLRRQREAIEVALRAMEGDLAQHISAVFSRHDASLAAPSSRMEDRRAMEEAFYFQEVPMLFEAQCRASVDTMNGERQAMQLNTATVRAPSCVTKKKRTEPPHCSLSHSCTPIPPPVFPPHPLHPLPPFCVCAFFCF